MTSTELALLCQKSYLGGDGWITLGDLRYGIFDTSEVPALVFRGSDNGENWLRDFDVLLVDSPTGYRCHAGFMGAFNALKAEVLPKVKGPMYITGHSLGGAIAVLFAEATKQPVVTFGCPKVYSIFTNGPEMLHSRIICNDDPVPMSPPIGYRHICPPTVLESNEFINPKDHCIEIYLSRLQGK